MKIHKLSNLQITNKTLETLKEINHLTSVKEELCNSSNLDSSNQ